MNSSDISFLATGDSGVAPAYGTNADGSASAGILGGITSLANALGNAAPFVAAINKQPIAAATTQAGQSGYFVPVDGQRVSGMSTNTMLLIGAGVLVAIVAVVMIAKKTA